MTVMKQNIREIWKWNKEEEMNSIGNCLRSFRYIAIDTEFPGCLKTTSMKANDEERYTNMRFNVGETKLIQLGFTLFDGEREIGGTWEVNFSDFNESKDAKNEKSIAFLRNNGLNLEKIREEGIGLEEFFEDFAMILAESKTDLTWVTFDGSYDLAYLLKGLTGGKPLPETSEEFWKAVEKLLPKVIDVKILAGIYNRGLSSSHGLQRMADTLQIKRVGVAHHAGSDSELTARVFKTIALALNAEESEEEEDDEAMMMNTYYLAVNAEESEEEEDDEAMMMNTYYLAVNAEESEEEEDDEAMMMNTYYLAVNAEESEEEEDDEAMMMNTYYLPQPHPMMFTAYPCYQPRPHPMMFCAYLPYQPQPHPMICCLPVLSLKGGNCLHECNHFM